MPKPGLAPTARAAIVASQQPEDDHSPPSARRLEGVRCSPLHRGLYRVSHRRFDGSGRHRLHALCARRRCGRIAAQPAPRFWSSARSPANWTCCAPSRMRWDRLGISWRRHAARRARAESRRLPGRRGAAIPDQPARRRHWPQLDRGRLCVAFGSMVEPGRGGSGIRQGAPKIGR